MPAKGDGGGDFLGCSWGREFGDQTRELGGCPGVTGYLWDVYGKGLRRGKERIKVDQVGMSIGMREKGGSMQGDLSSLST